MSGKKIFSVFVEAIHQEILSWSPKPRFVFKDFWYPLVTKAVEEVVQSQEVKDKVLQSQVLLKKEKEANVPEISWERDGSVYVTYTDVMHHFNLEYGHIKYTCTSSEAADEIESFDTQILEEELSILWNLKEKKKDTEKKEKDNEDDVENQVKMLITQWIKLGVNKSSEDLRKLANDKQQLKKHLKELKKREDEFIAKLMWERKQEENKLKRELKLKKIAKGRKGKKAPAPEAPAPEAPAPEATAPEATAPEATAPEATAPEATVSEATVPVEK